MKFINVKTGVILEPTDEVAKLMAESEDYKEYKEKVKKEIKEELNTVLEEPKKKRK